MHVINLKLDTFDKVLNVPAIIGVRETPLIFIAMLFTDCLFYIYQQFNFEFQTVTPSSYHTLISMQCDKVGGSQLKVTQFHFTSWPDHGVPEYAGPILNYLCRMKAQMKLSRGPTLVHCRSARVKNGVGRTLSSN